MAIHYFSGERALLAGDLTQEADAMKTIGALGGLDILINNAGSRKLLHEIDVINMTSMMLVSRAAAPHLTAVSSILVFSRAKRGASRVIGLFDQ